jgi:hypothetical protein
MLQRNLVPIVQKEGDAKLKDARTRRLGIAATVNPWVQRDCGIAEVAIIQAATKATRSDVLWLVMLVSHSNQDALRATKSHFHLIQRHSFKRPQLLSWEIG